VRTECLCKIRSMGLQVRYTTYRMQGMAICSVSCLKCFRSAVWRPRWSPWRHIEISAASHFDTIYRNHKDIFLWNLKAENPSWITQTKMLTVIISRLRMCAKCPSHIILDVSILVIFFIKSADCGDPNY
jgi:hypothetical protein